MLIEADFYLPKGEPLAFRHHAERLRPIFQQLQKADPHAKDFFLGADTIDEAYLYRVFDADGQLTTAAEAVLETEYKKETTRTLHMWNGEEGDEKGLSVSYLFNNRGASFCSFEIAYRREGVYRIGGRQGLQSLVETIVHLLKPVRVCVGPRYYAVTHKVFKDRPGIGWMLYLPTVLTAQQVPEARALVPVMDKKKQIGTMIFSVIDEPFDINNPEHIKIANAIEIRLVDQDLLPRYVDQQP